MTIGLSKRGSIVNNSKIRLATIALIVVAMFSGTAPAQAAAAKPGTPVKATAADKLEVGKVGFTDESYCFNVFYYEDTVSRNSCGTSASPSTFLTSWAFAVTNKSKTKSASQVQAQVTFFDKAGSILFQKYVTVAREIKPGKVSYAASSTTYADAAITGVATATVKLVSPKWIIPSTKIYQNPISLNTKPGSGKKYCGVYDPCATEGGSFSKGAITDIATDGIFTLRGPAATLHVVIVYLNMQGDPIGGWSGIRGPYSDPGVWNFKTGSQQVTWGQMMTPYEVANTATVLFVPQI